MDKIKKYLLPSILVITSVLQGCTSDYTCNLGGGYVFYFEGGDLNSIFNENPLGGEIPPNVLSYNFDRNYIIVKQLPRESIKKDSISYFIIFKKEKKICGPFNWEQYIREKSKYKITLDFKN